MTACILVEGPEAEKFLQGQLTCDLKLLEATQPLRGAHCNQKGRVEAVYDIFLDKENIVLLTPPEVIQHAFDFLKFYARFSKVKLSIIELSDTDFHYAHDLKKLQIQLYPTTIGRYLPQELGLMATDAVSLTKGCYLGQEIIARLHYLGKLKKELVFTLLAVPTPPGHSIYHAEWQQEVDVIDSLGREAVVLKQR